MIEVFLSACGNWLSDGYFCDIRYIAEAREDGHVLLAASVLLNPLPPPQDVNLQLEVAAFVFGQAQLGPVAKQELLATLADATKGTLSVHGKRLMLERDGELHGHAPLNQREAWFSPLHFQLIGKEPLGIGERLATIDTMLRAETPPFDGLTDLANWLALPVPQSGHLSTLSIAVNPPVDLLIDRSHLSGDRLTLALLAHPTCDISKVRLAVRAVPGQGLRGRFQIADSITWGDAQASPREGTVVALCPNTDSALAMLMVGSDTVRRQWFVDPAKAANRRLIAVQHFDRELRMVKQGLFESSDSARFETSVAALLFLLGFAPAVQVETDSPDLIVATPGGQFAVVECTTRIADVIAKVGKLVDRRGALSKAFHASGHSSELAAALVCRLPRDQIAVHSSVIRSAGVILVAAEELNEALIRARFHPNADELLAQARQALVTDASTGGQV